MTETDQDVADILAVGDFEVIEPPEDLKEKATPKGRKKGLSDPIKEAEKALERLSTNFDLWMRDEIRDMMTALDAMTINGIDQNTLSSFHRAVHDIKGQASTLGYPIAGQIAHSLCVLIEAIPKIEALPMELVDQHAQAIRAVVSEGARDETDAVAAALSARLEEVTSGYLASLGPDSVQPGSL